MDRILERLEQAGFSTEIQWKASRIGDEWIAQSRKRSGQGLVSNEAEVAISAPDRAGPYFASVEAEIYTRDDGEAETTQAALAAIQSIWPDVPADVVRAFEGGQGGTNGPWTLTFEAIPHDGYIVRLEGLIPAGDSGGR